MKFGTDYVKHFPDSDVNLAMMKTRNNNKRNIVKGLKLTFLTIVLQSSLLGLALLMKANDMLPADFVNYSGRLTSKDSPEDVNTAKAILLKQKAYTVSTVSQNELTSDELSGESTEVATIK
jgi:hypothetical protein